MSESFALTIFGPGTDEHTIDSVEQVVGPFPSPSAAFAWLTTTYGDAWPEYGLSPLVLPTPTTEEVRP